MESMPCISAVRMKEQMYQGSGLLVVMVRNESKSELIVFWDGWISAATIAEKSKY